MNTLNQLTHLVYQFGPFAFALIFLFVMARWGQKKWAEANARKNPPATDAEKNTYRAYFVLVSFIGVVLVGISVYWWWTHQPIYLYEGQIEQVSETDTVEGTELYVRNDYYQQAPNSPQIRDVHFVLIQKEPFIDGQEVSLRYFRDRRLAKPLVINLALNERPSFSLEYDESAQVWRLKKKGRTIVTGSNFISSAYAQSVKQVSPVPPPRVLVIPSPALAMPPGAARSTQTVPNVTPVGSNPETKDPKLLRQDFQPICTRT